MGMLVNTTMAELSDLTFRTAFIVYIVALIMSFVYYGRVNSAIEARREALAEQKVLVGAGGPEVVEKQLSSQEERELRKKMNALERKIAKEDERAAALEADIAELSETGDFDAIGAKTKELTAVKDAREELEMEWLELGEQLEG